MGAELHLNQNQSIPTGPNKKVLVVEKKLVRNRGHFHTQIPAIQALLPNHRMHLLVGSSYNGFMGEEAGRFDRDPGSWSK